MIFTLCFEKMELDPLSCFHLPFLNELSQKNGIAPKWKPFPAVLEFFFILMFQKSFCEFQQCVFFFILHITMVVLCFLHCTRFNSISFRNDLCLSSILHQYLITSAITVLQLKQIVTLKFCFAKSVKIVNRSFHCKFSKK